MDKNEHDQNHPWHDGQAHHKKYHVYWPHWKRIHHTWGFWVFLILMIAAIMYYVMSADFALAPRKQMNQPQENSMRP